MPPRIRAASVADVSGIAAIYGHAVRTGVATFDLSDPPPSYWTGLLTSTLPGDRMLVAEETGVIVGYAYSGAFRPRPAYACTRETSVYLAPEATGRGLGTSLYGELLSQLEADGVHSAVAVVAMPNPPSVALHERLGFELIGTLREVGRKFDRWVDTRWYQLRIGG